MVKEIVLKSIGFTRTGSNPVADVFTRLDRLLFKFAEYKLKGFGVWGLGFGSKRCRRSR